MSTGLNGRKWNSPTCTRRGRVVHVSTGTDARHPVDFDENETIAAFKLRLSSIAGTAPEQQILVHCAKELQDDRTLGDYCITEGSVVHLTVRIRGGMRDNARSPPPPAFMVRNLTDTTLRKLYMREFTSPLNKNVVQFELFSLVGPVPGSSSTLGLPFNSSVRAFSGPSLHELHRKTYQLLANGVEGYTHFPVSLRPYFTVSLFPYCPVFPLPYFPESHFPISLLPYFPIDLFLAHTHWLSCTHRTGAPGFRTFGGKNDCQHEYNEICDALCRVCSRPCTRAISCGCVPCVGHLCGDCMNTTCNKCNHQGIPKVSRVTRHCILCHRVAGFWVR